MFKVEIRNDSVYIDGYVNAVERDSKVLADENGQFIEKIKSGAFQRAIDRAGSHNECIRILLNHNYGRELTSTDDESTNLFEDTIGLRCQCEIRDAEVVTLAREHRLSGWSFGFVPLLQSREKINEMVHRDIRDLQLREVSLLDDTRTPAYDGTSVEVRDYEEIRVLEDEIEYVDSSKPEEVRETVDLHEYENRYNATRMACTYHN